VQQRPERQLQDQLGRRHHPRWTADQLQRSGEERCGHELLRQLHLPVPARLIGSVGKLGEDPEDLRHRQHRQGSVDPVGRGPQAEVVPESQEDPIEVQRLSRCPLGSDRGS
jgi:hypothetical protein